MEFNNRKRLEKFELLDRKSPDCLEKMMVGNMVIKGDFDET